jgi:hypothetical protein
MAQVAKQVNNPEFKPQDWKTEKERREDKEKKREKSHLWEEEALEVRDWDAEQLD